MAAAVTKPLAVDVISAEIMPTMPPTLSCMALTALVLWLGFGGLEFVWGDCASAAVAASNVADAINANVFIIFSRFCGWNGNAPFTVWFRQGWRCFVRKRTLEFRTGRADFRPASCAAFQAACPTRRRMS